jgi:hypothetical protein
MQQQVLNITSVCLNSCLSYQACKSRASVLRYILLSSVAWLYLPHFSTLSHKRHDFRKIFIESKMSILIFSTTFLQKISNSKKNSARHYYKCTRVFMYSICNCRTLTVLEFCRQILEKYWNDIKFHENPSGGSPVVQCGHMNRHDEAN